MSQKKSGSTMDATRVQHMKSEQITLTVRSNSKASQYNKPEGFAIKVRLIGGTAVSRKSK